MMQSYNKPVLKCDALKQEKLWKLQHFTKDTLIFSKIILCVRARARVCVCCVGRCLILYATCL